jgi:hypothetical protein
MCVVVVVCEGARVTWTMAAFIRPGRCRRVGPAGAAGGAADRAPETEPGPGPGPSAGQGCMGPTSGHACIRFRWIPTTPQGEDDEGFYY